MTGKLGTSGRNLLLTEWNPQLPDFIPGFSSPGVLLESEELHVTRITQKQGGKWHSSVNGHSGCFHVLSWSRKWKLTPVFLPGKFHGLESLGGSLCHKELDTAEHTRARLSCLLWTVLKWTWGCVYLSSWFSLDICPGVGLLDYVHDKICLSFLLVGHLIASSNWSTFLGLFLEGGQEGSPSQGPKGLLRSGHSRISLSPLCKWQELWKAD